MVDLRAAGLGGRHTPLGLGQLGCGQQDGGTGIGGGLHGGLQRRVEATKLPVTGTPLAPMLSSPTNLGLNPGGRDVLASEPQQLDIIAVDIRSAEANHRSHEGGYYRFIYHNLQPSMEAGHSRAGR
jgi:hypothetical protein